MNAIVWSKDGCAYCDQAKRLLSQNGIVFEERKLGHGWSKDQLLQAVPSARTVPQIFINDQHVGGFNELQTRLRAKQGA